MRTSRIAGSLFCALATVLAAESRAQIMDQNRAKNDIPQAAGIFGPFNVDVPVGGDEYDAPLAGDWRLGGDAGWTMSTWVEQRDGGSAPVLVGGADGGGSGFYLAFSRDRVGFFQGGKLTSGSFALSAGWHRLTAVGHGGNVTIYLDGRKAIQSGALPAFTPTRLRLAPRGIADFEAFGGRIAGFTLLQRAQTDAEVRAAAAARPNADLIVFDTASPQWPVQA